MITCEELDLLYTDIQNTPALNGTYDSYFTSSPTYSPKSTVCNKLIEFCTLLQEYLIQEGYDAHYTPSTGYPANPMQNIWIYLDRGKHRMLYVAVDRSALLYDAWLPSNTVSNVETLMAALHEDMLRYQEYCIHEVARESVRVQCNACYYRGGPYCGLGMEMVPDCMHHMKI